MVGVAHPTDEAGKRAVTKEQMPRHSTRWWRPLHAGGVRWSQGGVRFPVLRCAGGATSPESFHLHLARFIPGM